MSNSEYPQSEKLADAHEDRIAITEFLEWLDQDQGIILAEYDQKRERYGAVLETANTIIMRYLGIDEAALEQERRAMLAAAREENQ